MQTFPYIIYFPASLFIQHLFFCLLINELINLFWAETRAHDVLRFFSTAAEVLSVKSRSKCQRWLSIWQIAAFELTAFWEPGLARPLPSSHDY